MPDPAWIRQQYDKLKVQVAKETAERIKAEKERVKKVLAEKAKIKRATGGLNTGAGNTNNNSSSNGSSGNGNGNGNKGSGNRNGKPGLNFNPATGLRTFCGENPPTPPLGMKWVKTAGQCILYAPSGTTTTAVTVGVKVTEWKEVDESFTEAPPKKLSPPGPKGNGNGKGNTQSNTQGNTSTTQATNATQTQGNTTNTTHTHGNTTTADPDLDSDVDMGDPDDDDYDFDDLSFTTPIDRGTPPVPKLRPAADVVEKDGSTGGFMPMKLLPEYLEPSPDADGNYPEWEDVIANTVWRPRRVGEKTLSIGMDQEWGISTEFEFNGGGVDCGRSPYPVLITFPPSPRPSSVFILYENLRMKQKTDILCRCCATSSSTSSTKAAAGAKRKSGTTSSAPSSTCLRCPSKESKLPTSAADVWKPSTVISCVTKAQAIATKITFLSISAAWISLIRTRRRGALGRSYLNVGRSW